MSAKEQYHFVGIGGYGMSGLAQVLLQKGHPVSGSDVKPSERTERLAALGATIHVGHAARNINGAQRIIYSTDVPGDNPELQVARERGLAVLHRSQVLAELINDAYGIAVSGSHGKTTVTAMTALLLERCGLDPTVVVGAEVDFLGGNARLGRGRYVVAEADESDGSFVRYHPQVAVVTNVEPEHLDRYGGQFDRLVNAFRQFLSQVKPGGLVVLCTDDPMIRLVEGGLAIDRITYGLGPEAELRAEGIVAGAAAVSYRVTRGGRELGQVTLVVPGVHNVVNSLAALAVGLHLGLDFSPMAQVLGEFRGAKRRFQIVGQRDGITVVDDYAHHPTEIMATLRAARERTANRVIAVFQPQRYVRTHLLLQDFSRAFGQADEIILTEIYSPPGEQPIPGVNSRVLADLIHAHEQREVNCFAGKDEIVDYLQQIVQPGDTILTMGAGDIWKVAVSLVERLEAADKAS